MSEVNLILELLSERPQMTSSEIYSAIDYKKSSRTLNRLLEQLIDKKLVEKVGVNKGTRYSLSKSYGILHSIDLENYFEKDIDERVINESFNHELLRKDLYQVDIFTDSELAHLATLQEDYSKNISQLSEQEYLKEIERLAIDLSWKS
ncbi:MAG: helix-turn-helix domain-containing protein, partial [Bacteroidota bacterium]